MSRVYNHPPHRPVCNERLVGGQLRGACLNDDETEAVRRMTEGEWERGAIRARILRLHTVAIILLAIACIGNTVALVVTR